ncbi:DUF6286 domain-containing protein [Kribbella solani]|uniref:DUF6286 domain-containing protein n=1 Tax=Kribbella solani TaxID=236067 RepID=UPI0029BE16CB|nr:DUF6286 domain-containing protein [Kribbella solani]MDX3005138.1 DUF6286 domain-containing protein [Kribbella solani]
MAEPSPAGAVGAVSPAGAVPESSSVIYGGDRGRLDIAQRAVERIAEITARRHHEVVRQPATLGRGLPKARAVLAGQRARIELEVATNWGRPLSEIATELHQDVTNAIQDFTGLGVDRVDVQITAVTPARTTSATSASPRTSVDHVGANLARTGTERMPAARPAAAKPPVARPAAGVLGVLGALAVIALGLTGIAETLRSAGLLRGQVIPATWYGRTLALHQSSWLPAAAITAIVLGALVLTITLKPCRRTHLAVHTSSTPSDASAMLWIRARDVARLAADAANRVDSVTGVSVTAKRRTLRATVTTFGDSERVTGEVRAAVDDRLAAVTPSPRLRITLQED